MAADLFSMSMVSNRVGGDDSCALCHVLCGLEWERLCLSIHFV
jgi:hypothetical protein